MRRQLDRDTRQFLFAAQFPVHVGIDAAKGTHTLVARGPDGVFTAPLTFPVGHTGFDTAAQSLQQAFPVVGPDQMLVGIEFAGHHGVSLAHDLHARGCHVVAVLAKSAKQTRDGSLSGRNKTDRIDAKYICVTLGRGTFVRYPFLRSPIAELKPLVMARHRLIIERARLKNRIQGMLDLVWPEFAGHFSSLEKAAPQAILRRWPLPQDLLAASPRTVREFIATASRGKFKADWTRAFLASARTSVGLRDATDERRLELEFALARKDLLDAQIVELDDRITHQVARCPEAQLLLTVPEVSAVCAATIVAELGDPAAFEHPGQWLKLAGLHLEGRQSGQMDGRKRIAKQGRPLLRRQLYLLAGRWALPRGPYRADYEALRARSFQRTKAVCALARRLVPVLFAVVERGRPFDRALFDANRRRPEPRS
jgi:transposase